jgi:hypothetical protein
MLTDAGVHWEQADRLAIQTDRQHQGCHAGHVNDVLTLGSGQVLAAADSGGVWQIQAGGGHGLPEPFARPLSNDWDNPDTNALAFGPDGAHHVFAGCKDLAGTTDRLYESDSTAPVRPRLESGAGFAYHHHIGARGEGPLYRSSAGALQQIPLTPGARSQLKSAYHRLLVAVVGLAPRVRNLDDLLADGSHGLEERVRVHEALAAVELGAATLDRLAQTADLTAPPAGLDRRLVQATALVREGVGLLNHLPAPLRTELHAAGASAQTAAAIAGAVQEVVDTGATLAALESSLS